MAAPFLFYNEDTLDGTHAVSAVVQFPVGVSSHTDPVAGLGGTRNSQPAQRANSSPVNSGAAGQPATQ